MVTPNSSTIATADAKTHFSQLLDRVERGEEITITRHGEPIARMLPIPHASADAAKQAIERMIEARKGSTLGGISWKELRDEGRR